MQRENWVEVIEFPKYHVSNMGRVLSVDRDYILIQTLNQQGIPYVRFSETGIQHVRSVAILVAEAFLPKPRYPHFDTPINVDGNRKNNNVDNLMWRPRWFAVKYHKQFKIDIEYDADKKIIEIGSETIYENTWEAAKALGLLELDIFLSIQNSTTTFPMGYRFEYVDCD